VLPSLRLRDAAVVNLSSSAVANTLPGGGAVAVLLYRAVTCLLPVPLGAGVYLCWRHTRRS
jgi:uncharacterized membrane protein YbhN (UPF0104 family)